MNSPRDISVTAPFGQALERVKTVLFQPFDVAKWFVIGFCAWLAYLFEGGFNGGFNYGGGGHGHGGNNLQAEFEQARHYVLNNLGWIVPLAITLVLIGLAFGLVVLWLSSRGRFMFLHCVALNTAEVAVPWRKYAKPANSLFLFRIVLALAGMVTVLPAVVGLVLVIVRMVVRQTATVGGVAAAAGLFLGLLLLGVVFWVIQRFMRDFVVPVQFLRGSGCMAAWREVGALVRSDLLHFVLYLLFRIAMGIGIAIALIIVVLATCCCAGCLFALPYLGTVLLLPVLVLERSYSIYFLAQYGSEYSVFPIPPSQGTL